MTTPSHAIVPGRFAQFVPALRACSMICRVVSRAQVPQVVGLEVVLVFQVDI